MTTITWFKTENVAQYGGANWNEMVTHKKCGSVDKAKEFAGKINSDFFFYCREDIDFGNDKVFTTGDAIFFMGTPDYARANQCDLYVRHAERQETPVSTSIVSRATSAKGGETVAHSASDMPGWIEKKDTSHIDLDRTWGTSYTQGEPLLKKGLTLEEAQREAQKYPECTFFFYCTQDMWLPTSPLPLGLHHESELVGKVDSGGPEYKKGDAVFYFTPPEYGTAPTCIAYVKQIQSQQPDIATDEWYRQLWKRRHSSLKKAITSTKDMIEKADIVKDILAEQKDDRNRISDGRTYNYTDNKTIVCWLLNKNLSDFADILFDFLYQELFPTMTNNLYPKALIPYPRQRKLHYSLKETTKHVYPVSKNYVPNYIMDMLQKQISVDLSIIEKAFQQRQAKHGETRLFENTLRTADILAEMTITQARKSGYLDIGGFDINETTVLSYLDRKVETRLVPYAGIALIAIPYSTIQETDEDLSKLEYSTDFVAIPHEVGHFIYQYGQIDSPQEVGRKLHIANVVKFRLTEEHAISTDDWRLQWLEEIFADAYGCLIAGPIAVLGMHELLVRSLPVQNQDYLGSHPFPALRPLVQTQILRHITNQSGFPLFADAPEILDAHWQQLVKNYWPQWVSQQWPHGYSGQKDILGDATYVINQHRLTGKQILQSLEPLIQVVLKTLERARPITEQDTWSAGWNPKMETEAGRVSALYTSYILYTQKLIERHPYWYTRSESENGWGPSDAHFPERLPESLQSNWLEDRLDQLAKSRSKNPGIDDFIDLILFEGWSIEEPGPKQVGG